MIANFQQPTHTNVVREAEKLLQVDTEIQLSVSMTASLISIKIFCYVSQLKFLFLHEQPSVSGPTFNNHPIRSWPRNLMPEAIFL